MQIKKVKIRLPYITEEVFIGKKILDFLISKIQSRKYDKHILIVDINAKKDRKEYFNRLIENLSVVDVITLKPTPNYKSFDKCEKIIDKLIKAKVSRNSCLISIGGGYVSDITGYVASNYMRGIDFVQISTTLMSMVDSVIGKVAINFKKNKNLLGSFYSPRYVFSDLDFLSSLKQDEKILGLSEVWKHALIKRDNNIVDKIESYLLNFSDKYYSEFIYFSMQIKKSCVAPDHNDKNGNHKALSLGHTFANFLERDSTMRHGVAVVYGIIFVAILSKNLRKLSFKNYKQIIKTAKRFEKNIGLLREIQKDLKFEDVLESFFSDKISENNSLNFVLPTDSGYMVYKNVSKKTVIKSLEMFCDLKLEK
ncbi:MAG: 3-dehydroquinate synthase family protein [Parcubacteria group bacterium]|jgi:3-dehydroquinate synthase